MRNGSPAHKVDIVLLGDGYTVTDLGPGGTFERHAADFMHRFFRLLPFRHYRDKFNVYRVTCVSREQGADQGAADEVDTLFDAAYSPWISRLLTVRKKTTVFRYAARAPDYDIIIIMVNSSRHGGAGSHVHGRLKGRMRRIPAPVYAAGHPHGIRVAFHELGHSLANLADEYVDERVARHYSLAYITDKPNVDTTNDLARIKWKAFFKYPGARKLIGAFEGAYFRRKGVFRPQRHCLMRSLRHPFCHVCRKELARAVFRICGEPFDEEQYHRANPIK